MATTLIYFAAHDPDVTKDVVATPIMGSLCNSLKEFGKYYFASYNDGENNDYVRLEFGEDDQYKNLWPPDSLFNPPDGYDSPPRTAAYKIWNLDRGLWIGGYDTVFSSTANLGGYKRPGVFEVGDTLQCYPVWKIKQFTVTYNGRNGTNVPDQQTKYYGINLTLSRKKPQRDGYTFLGWNTNTSGTGAWYQPQDTYIANSDVTLYAIWSANPKIYTVTFNANGGSGEPDDQYKTEGKNLRLTNAIPNRDGYTFREWNTAKRGGGQSYLKGALYTADEDVTLYAQWDINKYAITYRENRADAYGAPDTHYKEYHKDVKLSAQTPKSEFATFVEWTTESDGSGTSYAPGDTYKKDEELTLYAQWDLKKYLVTYHANAKDVSNVPDDQEKYHRQALRLSQVEPQKTGYTFDHWNTQADGNGSGNYELGAWYYEDRPLDLYAYWEPNLYTVTFDANGGSGAPKSAVKEQDKELILPNETPSRTGYKFNRWNTTSSGSGTSFYPNKPFNIDGNNTTLYAIWTANPTITITYNANGGTGAPAAQSGLQETNKILSETIPTKANTSARYTVTYNKIDSEASIYDKSDPSIPKSSDSVLITTKYKFSHWTTAANGSGTKYYPKDTIKLTSNMTLYAQYTSYTDGGVSLPGGSLLQYELKGWSRSQNSGALVSDPFKPTGNVTLYAVWAPDGTGGMIQFPGASVPSYITEGTKLRLFGCKEPANDGLYTVVTTAVKNNVVSVVFAEDFAVNVEQDTAYEPLIIYGDGTFVPNMDYICSLNNRLFGCSTEKRTLYASALGDPTDFWRFQGDALDAYQVAVGSAGDFTGCVALNNNVLFFKQHTLHKLMGSFPAEYAVYTYEMDGVTEGNYRSVSNCDGAAIYVAEHGISTYVGASAGILSKELGEGGMHDAVSCYDGQRYALAFTNDADEPRIYIYDTRYGLWIEDVYGEVMDYAHLGEDSYCLTADQNKNAVYRLTTGVPDKDIDWEIVYKPFLESVSGSYRRTSHVFEKKRYTGIILRLELPKGSWIKADIKIDDRPWQTVARKAGETRTGVTDFVISTARADKLQLKLYGHGPMTILSMEREYLVGSRR